MDTEKNFLYRKGVGFSLAMNIKCLVCWFYCLVFYVFSIIYCYLKVKLYFLEFFYLSQCNYGFSSEIFE